MKKAHGPDIIHHHISPSGVFIGCNTKSNVPFEQYLIVLDSERRTSSRETRTYYLPHSLPHNQPTKATRVPVHTPAYCSARIWASPRFSPGRQVWAVSELPERPSWLATLTSAAAVVPIHNRPCPRCLPTSSLILTLPHTSPVDSMSPYQQHACLPTPSSRSTPTPRPQRVMMEERRVVLWLAPRTWLIEPSSG